MTLEAECEYEFFIFGVITEPLQFLFSASSTIAGSTFVRNGSLMNMK